METTKIKRGMNFKVAYYSLRAMDLNAVADEIMEQTGWSITTFYNKLNGKTRFKQLEIPVIETIFLGWNLDAWTGNKL